MPDNIKKNITFAVGNYLKVYTSLVCSRSFYW